MLIQLDTGRKIHLWGILKWSGYAKPFVGSDAQAAEELLAIAGRSMPRMWHDAPIAVVGLPDSLSLAFQQDKLPRVMSIGHFICHRGAQSELKDGSMLNVVWLEDDFQPTVSERAIQLIKGVPWEAAAKDFDW
jgi:hypothetical protein